MNFASPLGCILGGLVFTLIASVTGLPQNGKHSPDWDLSQPMNGFAFQRVKAIMDPTPDKPTSRFSRLRGTRGKHGEFSQVSALGRALRTTPTSVKQTFQNASSVGDVSTQYAIQCGWDGVPVWLIFDTGSSDTWAVQKGFECSDGMGDTHSREACGFGKPHIGDFGKGKVDDLHFYLKYGSGEYVSGPMGLGDISCGGVSVSDQQIGLANNTYWHGNNLTVGILGLAYPAITSAYYGDIGQEAPWNAITYSPFLTNAITQGSIDPVFSVALMKNSSDGVLAWGGLPPMDWRFTAYASTDLIVVSPWCQVTLLT